MTGILLHMQWPLTSQSCGSASQRELLFFSLQIKLHAQQIWRLSNSSTPARRRGSRASTTALQTEDSSLMLDVVFAGRIFLSSFKIRVTRWGEFSPSDQLFTFGSVLKIMKITEVAQIFGLLFPRYQLCVNFNK
jgi:hypothetical protein